MGCKEAFCYLTIDYKNKIGSYMSSPKKNDSSIPEEYEYELPGKPLNHSDEPLGQSFFTDPNEAVFGIKPFDPHKNIPLKTWKPWLIACAVVMCLGLIFEFGILGKNGKQGPLCHYLPQNKVCYILAGPTVSH